MKFRTAFVAACLIGAATLTPLTASAAALHPLTADPEYLGQGRPLAPRPEIHPPARIMSASPGYFIADVGTPSDHSPQPWDIQTVADGTTAGNYQRIRDLPDRVPELVGDFALEYNTGYVVARKIGTDPMVRYDAPAGSEIRGVYPGGMLIARSSGLALHDFDGTEKPVPGIPADAGVQDRTDSALLLATSTTLYVLDLATGTATESGTVTGPLWWAQLTPNRVIWQTGTTDTTSELAWKQRAGAGEGTVSVPSRLPLLPLGDDVAFLDPETGELARVTVDGGAVTRHFADAVDDAKDLGNGRLLVSTQGQLATVGSDAALTPVIEVPKYAGQARHVTISDRRIVISKLPLKNGFASENTAKALAESSDVGATWTDRPGSTVDAPQLAGESLLITDRDGSGKTTARIETPGGPFVFSGFSRIALGRGGQLAWLQQPGNDGQAQIVDLQSRSTLSGVSAPVGIDGSVYWTGVNPDNTITGRQLPGGLSRSVPVRPDCGLLQRLQVAGRWAVLDCSGPDQVVDLDGVVPVRTISLAAGWLIGAGYVAQPSSAIEGGLAAKELLVTDLNAPGLTQGRYGPIAGRMWRGLSFAPDDSAFPRIAYIDPDGHPRLIDLNWLATPPTTDNDKTPPALTTASAGPRVSDTPDIPFSWAYTDPTSPESPGSGVASYDVRYQQRTSPSSPYGDWVLPPNWQALPAQVTQLSLPGVARGTDTCFQVRAKDKKANQSEWSSSYCAQVDGQAPALVSSSSGDRVVLTAAAKYSYSFTDDKAVVSYDVAYRTAAAGQAFGAWVYPAPWQGTTATSVDWAPALGADRCFMVRARDAIGNTSAWSAASCSVTPQDDRALTAAGSVSRTTSTMAFRLSTSTLNASGAALSKTGESGVRVALVTLNGPGQGSVDVYHAGVKLGRVSLASTTWTRKVTYLPVTPYRTGTVQVVSVAAAPAVIDAIALLRS
jgi:hypothetical protein